MGLAIELYLKVFLLREDFPSARLKRKYGHDLEALLAEAKNRGIEELIRISPQITDDLKRLNALYPQSLRYFSLTHLLKPPSIPPLARLFRFANSLSKGLERHVAVKP